MGWLVKRDSEAGDGADTAAPPLVPRHRALDALADADREAIAAAAHMRKFSGGDALVEAHALDDGLFLIVEGEVGLLTPQGGHLEVAATVGPGGYVGALPVPKAPRRRIAAVARGPVTAMSLSAEAVAALPESARGGLMTGLQSVAAAQTEAILVRQADGEARARALAARTRVLLEARQAACADSELVRRIVASVPALPMYATRLAMVLEDESASAAEVVDLAKLDPSLAGVVLKTVNSPYYNLTHKVTDLQHAVVLLGFDQVHQLVMSAGMASTMPNTPEFKELKLHANAVSFISMELARLGGAARPATMATAGLLHDIGVSVVLLMAEKFPNLKLFLSLLDSGKLGAMLLERWELPPSFCQTVMYQAYAAYLPPEELPEPVRRPVATLYLAHQCYEILRGRPEAELTTPFLAEYVGAAGLEGANLQAVMARVVPAVNGRMAHYPEPMRKFFAECMGRSGSAA